MKWIIPLFLLMLLGGLGWVFRQQRIEAATTESLLAPLIAQQPDVTVQIAPPSPSPTPRPLTFAEMNQKYGPCISLPVLMYHHIQSQEQATANKQASLTVYTPTFREQMSYLKEKGYISVEPKALANFFESGTPLPAKPILITIDDGYEDNYTDMFPVIKELGLKATVFLATGLMENPGYLTWAQINEMAGNGIYFGNHTWSHQNMKTRMDKIDYELTTAQGQLEERGLNKDKVFAYPYGLMSGQVDDYLKQHTYSLAFDTLPGRTQCAQRKYAITRTRVGNTKLSSYGL